MNASRFHSPTAGFLRRSLAFLAGLSLGLLGAAAQTSPYGAISGTVTAASTKLALEGVRVSVAGTNLETFTDQAGHYSLLNVPATSVSLTFSYVGYPDVTQTVTVQAGQTLPVNVAFAAKEEVVKMGEFTITDEVVGVARSINEERAAPALTDVVASDVIGQLPNKNVAESLERVPGIEIARDKGEGRYINILGLDPQYVGISMNGIRMSTSEKGTREAALDTISSTMIASMDVNKVNMPDMDSDNMGGSVDIMTRDGLDQQGVWGSLAAGTNYSHQENRKGGYNFAENFGDSSLDGGKVAFSIDASSDYRPFTAYTEPSTGWTLLKSPTDGSIDWIDLSQDFRHYDAQRWREAMSSALDYKISDNNKAWIRFFTTDYTERNNQWLTTFPYGTSTVEALSDYTATVSIKAAGLIKSEAQIANNKREGSTVAGLDSTFGDWTNKITTAYTTGKYTRPTDTIAFANSTATVVSYGMNGPYNQVVDQISGPPIDNPASYAFSTKSSYSNTTANMHEETVKDDVKDTFDLGDIPAFFQFGGEYRCKNNNENTFKEAITSIPWANSLAANVFPSDDSQDTMGSFPDMRILPGAVQNFYQNQSAYGQSLTATTTYGGAFEALEDITAGYAMGGVTLGKLKITVGGRVEATNFWILGWSQETTTTGAVVITPVSYGKAYADFLPALVGEYEFDPKTVARFSYTETLARPDYTATAPGRTVNDETDTVSQGNPELPPLLSDNWDASIEHYFAPLGVVSVAGFYKSITNFTYQAQSGIDPTTGYALSTYFSGPSAWIYGLELNWVRRLDFLPGMLNGFGLSANALLGDSQAVYPTRPGEDLPFAGFAKKSGNAAITYDYRGLHLQVAANYHGKRLESGSTIGSTSTTSTGVVIPGSTQDQYEDKYITIDTGASYAFDEHWQIYLNGANLNNEPLKEYYGGTGSLYRLQTYEAYGWSLESGVRWTY